MRIELRDGQWADLREHITHGAEKRIRRSLKDPDDFEFMTTVVDVYVRDWYVKDPETNEAIPVDAPDRIDRAPDDVIDVLLTESQKLWKSTETPNPPMPPSSGGSSSDTP